MRVRTLSLAFVPAVVLLTLEASAGAASLDAWKTTWPVVVTNPAATTLTDYQVQVMLDTAALVAAGKLAADGSDLRVTAADGVTELPFFVEAMSSATTVIWVRIPTLPAGATTVRLYGGAAGVAAAANGKATFDLWEPFDSADQATFVSAGCGDGTMAITGGHADLSWRNSGVWTSQRGGPNDDGVFPVANVYRADVQVRGATGNWPGVNFSGKTHFQGYSLLSGSGAVRIGYSVDSASFCRAEDWASSEVSLPESVAGTWSLAWISPSAQWASFPGVAPLTSTSTNFARDEDLRVVLGGIESGYGTMSIDSVRVRKYAATEPTAAVGTAASRLPSAPTISGVTTASSGAVSVSFAEASANGSPITGYTATCNGVSATGASSPIVVAGIAGATYTCSVTAGSAAGASPASAEIAGSFASPPGAPSLASATAVNGSATLTFTPPESDGGGAITGYVASCTPSGSAEGTASPLVVTGLTNGTAYTCSVAAKNVAGVGASSATITVTPRSGAIATSTSVDGGGDGGDAGCSTAGVGGGAGRRAGGLAALLGLGLALVRRRSRR